MANHEIVNKVAQSSLITFNLEDFFPDKVSEIDIAQFLTKGYFYVKKNTERTENNRFKPFNNSVVRIHCSSDAIFRMGFHSCCCKVRRTNSSFWAGTESELTILSLEIIAY